MQGLQGHRKSQLVDITPAALVLAHSRPALGELDLQSRAMGSAAPDDVAVPMRS